MKTVGSRNVKMMELDEYSLKRAFANIPTIYLKSSAQSMQDSINWYGNDSEKQKILSSMLEVIHIEDPKFETTYTEWP